MPLTSYEIAAGWSQSTRSNIEDLFQSAYQRPFQFTLSSQPVPDGNSALVTMDGQTHWDGTPVIVWAFPILPYAAFSALITKALGGFTADSAQVSIKTRNDQNGYGTYNAWLQKPQPGISYQVRYRNDGSWIVDLRLTFRIVAAF